MLRVWGWTSTPESVRWYLIGLAMAGVAGWASGASTEFAGGVCLSIALVPPLGRLVDYVMSRA